MLPGVDALVFLLLFPIHIFFNCFHYESLGLVVFLLRLRMISLVKCSATFLILFFYFDQVIDVHFSDLVVDARDVV